MKGADPPGGRDTKQIRVPRLAPWPVPDGGLVDGGRVCSDVAFLKADDLDKNAASATDPIYVVTNENKGYDAAWPARLDRPPPQEHALTVHDSMRPQAHYQLRDVLVCLLMPQLVFMLVSSALTFNWHFHFPVFSWFLCAVGLLPVVGAFIALSRNPRLAWLRFFAFQMLVAFLVAAVGSNINFWYCMNPFYYIQAMKSYSNIDPSQVPGGRLMDGGKVHFVPSARLVTDLSMSFTAWEVYCVAPISTPVGLPSQNSQLASYDFWAVGIDCCRSGSPSFACGEYRNIDAHSGIRLVDEEQAKYFRLAVEQAEAAYGLQARNPVFLYWVSDPDAEESLLFELGFKYWIMGCAMHFCGTVVAFLFHIAAFHQPARKSYYH